MFAKNKSSNEKDFYLKHFSKLKNIEVKLN